MKTFTKEEILQNMRDFHVFPGTNPNVTQEQIAEQIVEALNEVAKGNFDLATNIED